jgi:transposase
MLFKRECLKLVLEKHYSYNYVSILKGLNESNIRKWVGFYMKYGYTSLLTRKNQFILLILN